MTLEIAGLLRSSSAISGVTSQSIRALGWRRRNLFSTGNVCTTSPIADNLISRMLLKSRLTSASAGTAASVGLAVSALFDRPPHPLRRRRHLDMAHAEFAQRIDDGIDDDGERRNRAAFAGGPDAERMRRRRHFAEFSGVKRQIAGARHRIIHERCGKELPALRIVISTLHERLADALRDAAVHLAVNDERVDRAADIVNRGIVHDPDRRSEEHT